MYQQVQSYRTYIAYEIKNEVKMNLVILVGTVVQKIDFRFIYDRYKEEKYIKRIKRYKNR